MLLGHELIQLQLVSLEVMPHPHELTPRFMGLSRTTFQRPGLHVRTEIELSDAQFLYFSVQAIYFDPKLHLSLLLAVGADRFAFSSLTLPLSPLHLAIPLLQGFAEFTLARVSLSRRVSRTDSGQDHGQAHHSDGRDGFGNRHGGIFSFSG